MAARRNHHESGKALGTGCGKSLALDIQGVIVIKMDLYRIDALVEKEVIPEVLNELSCIEGRL